MSAESTQVATGQTPATTPTGSVTVGGATGNSAAPSQSTPSVATSNSGAASASDKRDGLRSRDREAR